MATKDLPAGDGNAAAEVPVTVTEQPTADPKAVETGGAKMIRVAFSDVFVLDEKTRVDGVWQEFNATAAKRVIEAANQNGVVLHVADKKG